MIIERATKKKLQKIEDQLLQEPLLKLQKIKENVIRNKTPKDALFYIIRKSQNNNTLFADNDIPQCDKNRWRSQGDLFRLMRYYFPTITFREVRQLLFELVNDDCINTSHCSTIEKRVYWRSQPCNGMVYHDTYIDEYGFKLTLT